MRDKISEIIQTLLSFIYVNNCICCKSTSTLSICKNCLETFEYNNTSPVRLWRNIKFYSAGKYQGNFRKAILALKFHNRMDISNILAKILYNYFNTLSIAKQKFQVVPVPIHKSKKKSRGYDQTELIAKKFSHLSENSLNANLLVRIKKTSPQFELNQQERKNNLENAFKVNKKFDKNLPVLLLDDICTTGITIQEAIKTLNIENIHNITVLTLSDVDLSHQSINLR